MSRWPMITALAMPLSLMGANGLFSQADAQGEIAPCASIGPNVVRLDCAKSVNKLDLSSPEATLDGYINSLRAGNVDGIRQLYLEGDDFTLNQAIPVISYEIEKKITLDQLAVDGWGAIPPALVGDVELQVRQITEDEDDRYSYWLREIDGQWMIYSHAGWGYP